MGFVYRGNTGLRRKKNGHHLPWLTIPASIACLGLILASAIEAAGFRFAASRKMPSPFQ